MLVGINPKRAVRQVSVRYLCRIWLFYLCRDCYTSIIKLIDQVTLPAAQRPKTCETRCTWPAVLPLTRAWQWFRALRGQRWLMPGQVHKSVHSSRILGVACEILGFLLLWPWFPGWAHRGNIMITSGFIHLDIHLHSVFQGSIVYHYVDARDCLPTLWPANAQPENVWTTHPS